MIENVPRVQLATYKPFERVILYARQHRANQEVNETLHRLVEYLQHHNVEAYQEADTPFDLPLPVMDAALLGEKRDLILVVGGDGSLLSAARMAIVCDVPVIGINRGHLGFLTDISPHDMEEQLTAVLAGHYQEEQRFLLKMRVHDATTTFYTGDALNDVVLSRGQVTYLIGFEVYINQQFVSYYRSDGLIISTPTGSTAYALSAGGPIMHPGLDAILLVPMFSHSLHSRPFVFDADNAVNIVLSGRNEGTMQVSCDGHSSVPVEPGQSITIEKNSQQLRLLHPLTYHYYDTLRLKLGWGTKKTC